MGFRITTWNVNGIRNPFAYQPWREKRTFQAMFDILESDILVMQETKIQRKDLRDDMVLVPGWDVYFSLPRHKKGYAGVAIYTRNDTCAPIRAEEGVTGILAAPKTTTSYRDLPKDQQIGGYPRPGQLSGVVDEMTLDSEGRCVILEFPAFVLLGVYSPANRDESRDDFRLGFLEALDVRIRNLIAEGKQVVLTGDLNVIRSDLDTAAVGESIRKMGMTLDDWMSTPSRRLFNQLIFEGRVQGERDEGREQPVLWDLCRSFHPMREGMYTCWDTKKNTRPANYGSRIDYVLCSDGLRGWFSDANIQEGLQGSDHCPVYAVMSDTVHPGDKEVAILDVMNPEDMFQSGRRQREWSQKDPCPLSARLIPEFDGRRNIRDMFRRGTLPRGPSSTDSPMVPQSSDDKLVADSVADNTTTADSRPVSDTGGTRPNESEGGAVTTSASSQGTTKRPAGSSDADASYRIKRGKTVDANTTDTRLKGAPKQSTLQGFFKPKSSTPKKEVGARGVTENHIPVSPPPNVARAPPTPTTHPEQPREDQKGGVQAASELGSVKPGGDRVFDPIEAKESWSKLLGRRTVPRCEHDEPCISLVTKKPGINCGRSFYICPRPLGPSGEKEKGSEWRCGTFIWSSDWGSGSGTRG